MDEIARRLREPSTMAGIAILASIAGAPPGSGEVVAQVVAGVAGLLAVLIPEGGKNAR